MEGEESLLDSIFDVENVEDAEDIEMVHVEEGELVGENHQAELGQSSSADIDAVAQEPHSKNRRRRNKKKNRKKKGVSGSGITDINRRLKERKSYLVWIAVGCLGVSVLSDLVKEFQVSVLQLGGFLLPCYVVSRSWLMVIRQRRRHIVQHIFLDVPSLAFFTTYALLVLFWVEIYYQSRAVSTNGLQPTFLTVNGIIHAIQISLWLVICWKSVRLLVILANMLFADTVKK